MTRLRMVRCYGCGEHYQLKDNERLVCDPCETPVPELDEHDARGNLLRRRNRRGQVVFKACATWREEFLADPGRARRVRGRRTTPTDSDP